MAVATTTALLYAGVALSAASSVSQGAKAKKDSKFNAAEIRQEAIRSVQDSRRQSTAMQENAKRSLASIRARFAKSGLDFVGTPAEVLAEKKFLLDREMRESKRQSSDRGRQLYKQAGLTEKAGQRAFDAGLVNAGTTIVSGFAGAGGFGGMGQYGSGVVSSAGGITQAWQGTPRINATPLA